VTPAAGAAKSPPATVATELMTAFEGVVSEALATGATGGAVSMVFNTVTTSATVAWAGTAVDAFTAAGTGDSMTSFPAVLGNLTPLASPGPEEDLAVLALAAEDAVDAMRELGPRLELRVTGMPMSESIFVVSTGMDVPLAWKYRSKLHPMCSDDL